MYEDYFGLHRRPFVQTVNPDVYVGLPSRDAALHRLRYGLEFGGGLAVLSGPCGAGKTILALRLAQEMAASTVHWAYPTMPVPDLIATLAEEFGAHRQDPANLAASIRALREQLSMLVKTGHRPFLILDEAQLITNTETLESLRLLLNFTTGGIADLAILLVGTPDLLLQLPASLTDRLAIRSSLPPFTESESIAYLEGRLADSGASEPLISTEAAVIFHKEASGLPRRLNHLADLALLVAYAEGNRRVDPRSVQIAAREIPDESLAA